jgi:hypothetical protein
VEISCLSSVTGYYRVIILGFTVKNGHEDIIICKWESNGVDHYDTRSTATSNCKNIGFPNLWSTGYITSYQTTPTNDRAMIIKYKGSTARSRLLILTFNLKKL